MNLLIFEPTGGTGPLPRSLFVRRYRLTEIRIRHLLPTPVPYVALSSILAEAIPSLV